MRSTKTPAAVIEFVRRFAELDGGMRLCTDPIVFDRALAEATQWR